MFIPEFVLGSTVRTLKRSLLMIDQRIFRIGDRPRAPEIVTVSTDDPDHEHVDHERTNQRAGLPLLGDHDALVYT